MLIVQQAENLPVLLALVNRPEIKAEFDIIWGDGPDPRGSDSAVLYRRQDGNGGLPGSAGLYRYHRRAWTGGNGDVQEPANSQTCDLNTDGVLDGPGLFLRPPLVVKLRIVGEALPGWLTAQAAVLTEIANHWNWKILDTAKNQYALPRRIQQARFVPGAADSRQGRSELPDSHSHSDRQRDANLTGSSQPAAK